MADPFVFTDEQHELRSVVRDFCRDHSDESTVRRLMESPSGFDPKAWGRLGSELGVLGLGVPEDVGGSGGGIVDAAVLAEELGAALFCGPVLGTLALSLPALVAVHASEVRSTALLPLVEGSRTAAFAVPQTGGRFAVEAVSVRASRSGDAWVLFGTVEQVVDAGTADDLLVAAICPNGIVALFVVEAQATGVSRTPLSTMDLTRRQADVRLRGATARLAADGIEALRVCRHAVRVGAVLLAAEQVGVSQHLLDLTVSYAKQRVQFGRHIGSFQAVKHRLADMFVEVEHARSAAYYAAWCLQEQADDPVMVAAIAQATCSTAVTRVAAGAVQLHGGIGFTWEHPAHLYFKRAFSSAALLGSAEEHRARIAELVLDTAEPGTGLTVATG